MPNKWPTEQYLNIFLGLSVQYLYAIEYKIQVSDILHGVNVTKPKKIEEQERCETLDKGCVKDGNSTKG